MAHGGKSSGRGKSQNQEDNGRGVRNKFGKPPRHISYHDIIFDGENWLRLPDDNGLADLRFR
jgi:hypothetical protein